MDVDIWTGGLTGDLDGFGGVPIVLLAALLLFCCCALCLFFALCWRRGRKHGELERRWSFYEQSEHNVVLEIPGRDGGRASLRPAPPTNPPPRVDIAAVSACASSVGAGLPGASQRSSATGSSRASALDRLEQLTSRASGRGSTLTPRSGSMHFARLEEEAESLKGNGGAGGVDGEAEEAAGGISELPFARRCISTAEMRARRMSSRARVDVADTASAQEMMELAGNESAREDEVEGGPHDDVAGAMPLEGDDIELRFHRQVLSTAAVVRTSLPDDEHGP